MEKPKTRRKGGFATMDPEKARLARIKGGQNTSGNFKNDPARAVEAAKKSVETRKLKRARD